MIKNSKTQLIIAYRGVSKIAPENTLKAVRKVVWMKFRCDDLGYEIFAICIIIEL